MSGWLTGVRWICPPVKTATKREHSVELFFALDLHLRSPGLSWLAAAICMELRHGAASLLEGLSQALAGLLPDRALSGDRRRRERVSFRQINKKTGNRLRQQLVDAETASRSRPPTTASGYEVDKGVYIQVEDEEIEALQIESRHTIEIDSFVPATQIDKRYYDSPYYIVPNDKVGQEAFAVIRDAMKRQGHGRRSAASCSPSASGRSCSSRAARACSARRCAIPTRCATAEEYFDDIPDVKISGRDAQARRAHRRDQGGRFRSGASSWITTRTRWSRC